MRILALETSAPAASVALLSGTECLERHSIAAGSGTAKTLVPAIRELLDRAGWSVGMLDLIAVTRGPGSFTGLRVGITTAKTLAYATGTHVLGVCTMRVIAERVPVQGARLCTLVNAQRHQLFLGQFTAEDVWEPQAATEIVHRDLWSANLATPCLACGPGLRLVADELPPGIERVSGDLWEPQAEALGHVARRLYEQGERSDFWSLKPEYIRPSAAEEKAARPDS